MSNFIRTRLGQRDHYVYDFMEQLVSNFIIRAQQPKENVAGRGVLSRITTAFREYAVGICVDSSLVRLISSLLAMAATIMFLTGLLDVVSKWTCLFPLWLHIVSTCFFVGVISHIALKHFRGFRSLGRQHLRGHK